MQLPPIECVTCFADQSRSCSCCIDALPLWHACTTQNAVYLVCSIEQRFGQRMHSLHAGCCPTNPRSPAQCSQCRICSSLDSSLAIKGSSATHSCNANLDYIPDPRCMQPAGTKCKSIRCQLKWRQAEWVNTSQSGWASDSPKAAWGSSAKGETQKSTCQGLQQCQQV